MFLYTCFVVYLKRMNFVATPWVFVGWFFSLVCQAERKAAEEAKAREAEAEAGQICMRMEHR